MFLLSPSFYLYIPVMLPPLLLLLHILYLLLSLPPLCKAILEEGCFNNSFVYMTIAARRFVSARLHKRYGLRDRN